MSFVLSAFVVLAILIALGAAVLAGITFYLLKRDINSNSSTLNNQQQSLQTIEAVIQDFSRDLEKKFLYYSHDPNKIININDNGLSIHGTNLSTLALGSAQIVRDNANNVLKFNNDGTSLSLTKDGVAVNSAVPKLRIGNHYISSTPLGMKVCDSYDNCTTIST